MCAIRQYSTTHYPLCLYKYKIYNGIVSKKQVKTISPSLNEGQQKAVSSIEHSTLVLAGAGTGKTKVIVERINYIRSVEKDSRNILAITFTNKAAREMKERIKDDRSIYFIGTFHGLGVRILKKYGRLIDVNNNFSIADRSDSKRIIKEAIETLGMDKRKSPDFERCISQLKRSGDTPDNFYYYNELILKEEDIRMVWEIYETLLQERDLLDFNDLVIKATNLLKMNKDIKRYYNDSFSHILIDEFQDIDEMQYNLITLLKGDDTILCGVGDIDQTIFEWRGADISFALDFEKNWKDTKLIPLEENYRSTKNIVSVANQVIEKNQLRKERVLKTENKKGDLIHLIGAMDEKQEAEIIADKIKSLLSQGVLPEDIAILHRLNFQNRLFEEKMIKEKIPYRILGTRFFERLEIKDLVSYMRYIFLNRTNFDLSRIINVPTRGIGKMTLEKVMKSSPLTGAQQKKVDLFHNIVEKVEEYGKSHSLKEVLEYLIKEIKYEEYLKQTFINHQDRVRNVSELVFFSQDFSNGNIKDTIQDFLESAALGGDQDELDIKKKGVSIMTIHSAKGLEFPYVFVTGMEEGLFPYSRDMDNMREMEEERRLFYVAITRAKEKLFLSFAYNRYVYGKNVENIPSSFLEDISDELIEFDVATPTNDIIDI